MEQKGPETNTGLSRVDCDTGLHCHPEEDQNHTKWQILSLSSHHSRTVSLNKRSNICQEIETTLKYSFSVCCCRSRLQPHINSVNTARLTTVRGLNLPLQWNKCSNVILLPPDIIYTSSVPVGGFVKQHWQQTNIIKHEQRENEP